MASGLEHIFTRNRKWSEDVRQEDPEYFSRLTDQQKPEYLWIGCSDSRVPANQIIDLPPGEVFVHRNIANMVVHTDLNCLSVLHYAVHVLKVKHVLVCGHYGCGGVAAAMDFKQHGLIDNWLSHIQDVIRLHRKELDSLDSQAEKVERLCELNVIEQVRNLCQSSVMRRAWEAGIEVSVHGVIYRLEDGLLQDLGVSTSGV